VKQEWLPSLTEEDRGVAAAVLGRRLSEQDASAARVARIRRRLEAYLGASTEIVIP